MTVRDQIIAEARTWMGTPWRHQAALKGVGTDCVGFIAGVALACGIPDAEAFKNDPIFKGYGRDPDPVLLEQGCRRYLEPIRFEEIMPADVLRLAVSGDPRHFAFVSTVDPTYIIHAYSMLNQALSRVVEHGLGPVWRARVDRAYRFRGVE